MKNKQFLTVIILMLFGVSKLPAQTDTSELKLSLKDAQDYAIANNKAVKSARFDLDASKLAVWETISAGLPQVNASGNLVDNLQLRTMLMDGKFFGDTTGRKYPIRFGSTYNTTYGFDASLLLFSAPFYIGLETVKLATKLTEKNLQRTEIDTREAVISAYYLTLVSEESIRILDGNIANLNETLKSTRSMYAAGMAESTDIDQMVSNVTMMQNTRSSMDRTIEMNYNMLRFQLGVPAETKIELTQTLKSITETINVETLLGQKFEYASNINYKLIEDQETMSSLTLKSKRAAVLPTLAGFYNYSKEGQGDKIAKQEWFPTSMVGLQLSIPILSSGSRYLGIKKAEINLMKARNTKDMVTEQLLLQEKQLKYNLVSANQQYISQKANIDVSKRVYTSMENKFKQGMASSLELTQANSLYLQAENNYISALMNLLQTKLSLDKLLNNM